MPAANFRLGNDFFSRNAYHIVISKCKIWLSCICKKMYVCVCLYRFLIFNPTSICNQEKFNPNWYNTCNDTIYRNAQEDAYLLESMILSDVMFMLLTTHHDTTLLLSSGPLWHRLPFFIHSIMNDHITQCTKPFLLILNNENYHFNPPFR